MPYNLKRSCFQQSPWPWDYPPGYKMGIPEPTRKFFSSFYNGGPRERMALSKGMNVEPFWFVMDLVIAARDAASSQFVPVGEFGLCQMMMTQSQASPASRTRMFQVVDATRGFAMDRSAVNDGNRFGTAQQAFSLPQPHYPGERCPIMVRIVNLATVSNTVQLVFFGMRPRPKTS